MYRLIAATAVGLYGPLCGWGALAATPIPTTASFAVSATVTAGCMVVGNPSQTSGVGFGMLDFGSQPGVLSTTVSTTVSMSGNGMAQMQCTSGVPVTMTIDGGQNASGSQRRMKRAPNYYVPYALYAAAGGNSPIAPGSPMSVNTSNGAMTLPVWGIASPPGTGLPAGQYSDTVQVLFSW